MSIHGVNQVYIDNAGTPEKWDSTGQGAGKVALYDAAGNALTDTGSKLDVVAHDSGGTALTSTSGKLHTALHAADGTAITETGGRLDVVTFDADGSTAISLKPVTLEFTDAAPTPSGSDVNDGTGGALATGDFKIRSTTAFPYYIPVADSGFKTIHVGLRFLSYNQIATVRIYSVTSASTNWLTHGYSELLDVSVPASSIYFTAGAGAVGTGGVAGSATVADGAHYDIGALAGAPRAIVVYVVFGTAPASGEHYMIVTRTR